MGLSLVRPRYPMSFAVNRCIFSLAITLHSTLPFCLIYPCVLTTVVTNTRTVSAAMPYSIFLHLEFIRFIRFVTRASHRHAPVP